MPRYRDDIKPNLPIALQLQLESLGEAIRHARKERGLNQRALADMIGVAPNTVVAMEQGMPTVQIGSYALAIWHLEVPGVNFGPLDRLLTRV
ncbi:helix-turn-helix domain-containing protein [Chitinimonas arctica]|uniref:Helix-turn-helix domain-containing protein n=1 Tax=Chitinimonas arctica TaxID=2594795 RepID=A0A516SBK2_9NEIS|nr:helix-turn-helix domain-containing protein [Chitinimonas arctica]QDQ25524.1 helix-turn-helix domain-containing protein [Chitinimonas arctica]